MACSLRLRSCSIALLLAAVGALPAAASGGPALTISDQPGDANGLNELGITQDSRPASLGELDLVSVRARTLYEAIPVGDDGTHYEPRSLEIAWTTSGPPGVPAGVPNVTFRLDLLVGGCRLGLEVVLTATSSTDNGSWHEIGEGCPSGRSFASFRQDERWRTAIDSTSRTISVVYPFDSLSPSESSLIAPGKTLVAARGESRAVNVIATDGFEIIVDRSVLVDATMQAPDWIVGSDIPLDVPCTRNCPSL